MFQQVKSLFMQLFRSAFLRKSLKNEHVKNKQLGSVVNLKPQADFTVAVLQSLMMTKTVFSETSFCLL